MKKLLVAALCCMPMLIASELLEEILEADSSDGSFISNPLLIFREDKVGKKNVHWNVDVIVATESLPDSEELTFEMDQFSLVPEVLYFEPGNDQFKSKKFFKTSFSLPRKDEQYSQPYFLNVNGIKKLQRTITVPGLGQELRFITTCCNDFRDQKNKKFIGPRERVWDQILEQHEKNPNHLMIGLGDQLYCDEVFNLPELKLWLSRKFDLKKFNSTEPTEEITEAVDQFFFHNYLDNFSKSTPSFSECLSIIPQINIWDDHDILDGFGSLPPLLQNSPMILMIGRIARKYCLLFQQGIRPDLTCEDAVKLGYLSNTNYSFFKIIGNTTFMAMDTRSERSIKSVMAPKSFRKLLDDLPSHITRNTKHLIVLSALPISNPDQRIVSNFAWWVANPYACKTRIFRGLAQWIGTKLGSLDVLGNDYTASNLDLDTWAAHRSDKMALIHKLQDIAYYRKVRATILTGDSHNAGVARIEPYTETPQSDPRHIWQFLTSPVGSVTANFISSAFVTYNEYASSVTCYLGNRLQERFLKWQKGDSAPYFIQRRNWLEVTIRKDDHLSAQLVTEVPNAAQPSFESFEKIVPPVSVSHTDNE